MVWVDELAWGMVLLASVGRVTWCSWPTWPWSSHSLDALLHRPRYARLGPAVEELLCLVTLLVCGKLRQINNGSSVSVDSKFHSCTCICLYMSVAYNRLWHLPVRQWRWWNRWAGVQWRSLLCSPSFPEPRTRHLVSTEEQKRAARLIITREMQKNNEYLQPCPCHLMRCCSHSAEHKYTILIPYLWMQYIVSLVGWK